MAPTIFNNDKFFMDQILKKNLETKNSKPSTTKTLITKNKI